MEAEFAERYRLMSVPRPYRRIARQLMDGSYKNYGHGGYVRHPKYAKDPEHYVRAYLLLQKDLKDLFDYVEPAEQNLRCYSYRIHELLLRACVEVEANCKAILCENGYQKRMVNGKERDLNMLDYIKIEQSHKLSEFEVRVPTWSGAGELRTPFLAWRAGDRLPWYQAYNETKHDRHTAFRNATFGHMLDAVCGCLTILSAQFLDEDYSSQLARLVIEESDDGSEEALGGYFRIKFPQSWPASDRYDFDWWNTLKKDPDPFQQYPYP